MRTYIHRPVPMTSTQEISAVVCNCCGKRFERAAEESWRSRPAGVFEVTLHGGLGDSYPSEDDNLIFDVCSDCVRAFVGTFRVPPVYRSTIQAGAPDPVEVLYVGRGQELGVWWDGNSTVRETLAEIQEYRAAMRAHAATPDSPPDDTVVLWSILEKFEEDGEAEKDVSTSTGRVFRHYKGNFYELIDLAIYRQEGPPAEPLVVVIYRALYGDSGLFARDLDEFKEDVEVDGRRVPRFQVA